MKQLFEVALYITLVVIGFVAGVYYTKLNQEIYVGETVIENNTQYATVYSSLFGRTDMYYGEFAK